ncbi:hypothetical protein [Jeotgalibacillus sp. R-1-5s-1]|uniref:hypothetical protein n=1 Tax=Jeotgalibacillus sp. R-1-5s-1 TaxID=2555897 RepID=UPI00106D0D3E|nr:hypothetical protein [Jeotgalibacillus sp. R-1-5s-1]TFE02499.1 hypothetical protein E2491_02860 [Jeotgalibacillus sp. R-1-5s-1]
MKSKKYFWYTAGAYSIIIMLISMAVLFNIYPGGYGYIYNEETEQITLERGVFGKEQVTDQVADNEALSYVLYQNEVDRAIQSWILVLTLGIFIVYLVQRIWPAYQNRKEEGYKVKDLIALGLFVLTVVVAVSLLVSLSQSIQYLEQVYNTVA